MGINKREFVEVVLYLEGSPRFRGLLWCFRGSIVQQETKKLNPRCHLVSLRCDHFPASSRKISAGMAAARQRLLSPRPKSICDAGMFSACSLLDSRRLNVR